MSFKNLFILILLFFSISCSDIKTGPVFFGDIPLPYGRLTKGEIYRDPEGRFQITGTADEVVIKKEPLGITLDYQNGLIYYGIYVYYITKDIQTDEAAFEYALNEAKKKIDLSKYEFRIFEDKFDAYRKYPSREYNFGLIPKVPTDHGRSYLTKFVRSKHYVYWLVADNINVYHDYTNLDYHLLKPAENFMDSVTFEVQDL